MPMKRTALASLMLTFALVSPTLAEEARWNELANLPFQQDYPTEETARRLTDELLFERGIQSYLWALPAINMWAMKQASEARFGAGYNVLPVWKERLSAKTLVTTPRYGDIAASGGTAFRCELARRTSLYECWADPRGCSSAFILAPKFAWSCGGSSARAVTLTLAMMPSLRRVRANAASPPLVA